MIHSSADDDAGVLSHQTLLSALALESAISSEILARGVPCVKRVDGQCLNITPLVFWHHDEEFLHSDSSILETLSGSSNVSIESIPITSQMVLAGRDTDSAQFLVLTYFFHDTDCLGNAGHDAWQELLVNATKSNAYLITETLEPRVIELSYASDKSRMTASTLNVLISLAYFSFAVYVLRSLRNMPPVHNPIGLMFTGVVEVVVSTITSLSVCALGGFKITMLPWTIFPLVIMFIGTETMSHLVGAFIFILFLK